MKGSRFGRTRTLGVHDSVREITHECGLQCMCRLQVDETILGLGILLPCALYGHPSRLLVQLAFLIVEVDGPLLRDAVQLTPMVAIRAATHLANLADQHIYISNEVFVDHGLICQYSQTCAGLRQGDSLLALM